MESSLCEKPERHAPRRLSDYLNLEGLKQKVHSLGDKVCLVSLIPLFRLRKPIHESWMRENCTSSLSGGRRSARRQLSAPPPTRRW